MPDRAEYTQKARDEFKRRFRKYPEEMRDSPVKLAVWCEILGSVRP